MPTAATLSKLKPEVEFQCGGRLGEFNGMSSLQSIITLEGAATCWIHCHDPRTTCQIAGCSHLAKSMSWSCRIAGCKNSIRHIENRFRHILFIFFLMEFGIRGAAAFVLFPIHLFSMTSWRTETEAVSRMEKAGPFDCCCSHQSVSSPSLCSRQGSRWTFWAHFMVFSWFSVLRGEFLNLGSFDDAMLKLVGFVFCSYL